MKTTRQLSFNYPGGSLIGKEERKAAIEVINSQSLFRYYGPKLLKKVEQFETAFIKFAGVKYALGVNSGTSALVDGMAALGVGPGDEVIVPAVTFIASVGAIVACKAIPVFAEIDSSLSIDDNHIRDKITPRTKAVIVVHIQCVAANMNKIMKVAKENKLIVIEDCAQSFGASFKGKKVGSFGDVGCFSLQMNKVITSGEGGVVCTNDKEVYERTVRYHDQGFFRTMFEGRPIINDSDANKIFGLNLRMSELTAAVALEQLKKLPKIINTTLKIKKYIKNKLKNLIKFREIPDEDGDAAISLGFVLKDENTAVDFVKKLDEENLIAYRLYGGKTVYYEPQIMNKRTIDSKGCPFSCSFYYDMPKNATDFSPEMNLASNNINTLHNETSGFSQRFHNNNITYKAGMCPVSEDIISRVVMLNLNPVMTRQDADNIIKGIKKSI